MFNSKVFYKILIILFSILYICVSFISFYHSIEFMNIGNEKWMAIILGAAFEVGQMSCLLALLLTDKNRKAYLPWILMFVLTSVQVIGNVYSVFKYISLSDTGYYLYLQKSLLFWIQEVDKETVKIIISWIIGALLPIIALGMTDMVASNIRNMFNVNNKNEPILDKENINEKTEIKNNDVLSHSNKLLNEDDKIYTENIKVPEIDNKQAIEVNNIPNINNINTNNIITPPIDISPISPVINTPIVPPTNTIDIANNNLQQLKNNKLRNLATKAEKLNDNDIKIQNI